MSCFQVKKALFNSHITTAGNLEMSTDDLHPPWSATQQPLSTQRNPQKHAARTFECTSKTLAKQLRQSMAWVSPKQSPTSTMFVNINKQSPSDDSKEASVELVKERNLALTRVSLPQVFLLQY